MTIFSSQELGLFAKSLDENEIHELLRGSRNTQIVMIACFMWFGMYICGAMGHKRLMSVSAYEYLITSALEYEFFWIDREWTRGRGFFFLVCGIKSDQRVIGDEGFGQGADAVHSYFELTKLKKSRTATAFICNKFWNIFEHHRPVRAGLLVGIALSISLSFILLSISGKSLTIVTIPDAAVGTLSPSSGCKALPPENFWPTYIPPLLFHIYLYGLAISVGIMNKDFWDMSEATRKVLWEYRISDFRPNCHLTGILNRKITSTVTFLLTIIFSSRTHILWLSIPATFSPIILSATSITLTRKAITTRMLLANKTSILTDSQDSHFGAIELMPMVYTVKPVNDVIMM
ncbi:hypothetical protein NP233_g4594 [Leucocoprinus birnbaumii]|uniref:Uncharacterized protein n=1 Tax=Leucocoprinus birnbaumii TaxID=56174 RepID=A0AAD5VUE4_9AGAR|nr:hypothetical protein NP233_g4594 [Leucocoprinus birnbaumii]